MTEFLVLAFLVPIVKDKLDELCSFKNYRSIAIISLILKLLDWVLLLNYRHLLKCDDLKFGFQELCSWLVYDTIDQYIRKGCMVYGCLGAVGSTQHCEAPEQYLPEADGQGTLEVQCLRSIPY